MRSKVTLPDDDRFPILCSDGTVIHNVEECRLKEADYPGSFTPDQLTAAKAGVRESQSVAADMPRTCRAQGGSEVRCTGCGGT